MAEDLLELGGKIKAEGNRRLSDVSDSSREGSVGSPSVVNERAHQKRMKKLEVKAAEERQKGKEEEERRVKRAVEENKRKHGHRLVLCKVSNLKLFEATNQAVKY